MTDVLKKTAMEITARIKQDCFDANGLFYADSAEKILVDELNKHRNTVLDEVVIRVIKMMEPK